jgi:ABC-type transport system substrate-binding protein
MCSFLQQSGWYDPRFEALVQQAVRMADRSRRMAMYREADRIWVVEQALAAPISYGSGAMNLVKPWVKGFSVMPLYDVDLRCVTIEK